MKEKEIFINTEFIRLDALLKFTGEVATGGQAKIFIQNGEVLLNGEICTQRGKKIFDNDKVTLGENTYRVVKK